MVEVRRTSPDEIKNAVLDVIENAINPELLQHHGWVELVQIAGNTVCVRFRGACSGCMSAYATLDATVKPRLMQAVKEIENVVISDEVSEELIRFSRNLFTHSD